MGAAEGRAEGTRHALAALFLAGTALVSQPAPAGVAGLQPADFSPPPRAPGRCRLHGGSPGDRAPARIAAHQLRRPGRPAGPGDRPGPAPRGTARGPSGPARPTA